MHQKAPSASFSLVWARQALALPVRGLGGTQAFMRMKVLLRRS
jgi:hypothetical protein